MPATAGAEAVTYRPMIFGTAKLHFVDAKLGLDEWQTLGYLAPLAEDEAEPLWAEADVRADLKERLERTPASSASFAPLPGAALRSASYAASGKSLAAHLYQSARAEVLVCDALDERSAPGENEGAFRARLSLKARERRDAAVEALRKKYAAKHASLEDRERRALERTERERSQLSQQKLQTALSVGAGVLGALFGRRKLSATNVNRAATAARAAGRIGRESDDVERADESLDVVRQRRTELQAAFDADVAATERSLMPAPVRCARAGEPAQVGHCRRRGRTRLGAMAQGRGWFPGAGIRTRGWS